MTVLSTRNAGVRAGPSRVRERAPGTTLLRAASVASRMRSTTLAVAVTLVVVLAGCSGAPSGTSAPTTEDGATDHPPTTGPTDATTSTDDGTPTTQGGTPTTQGGTATTTAGTTSPGAVSGSLPPGVNESGLVDPAALWQAHLDGAYDADGYRHVLSFANASGGEWTVRVHGSENVSSVLAVVGNATTTSRVWYADGGNVTATWNDSSASREYFERAGLRSVGPALVAAVAESYPATFLRVGSYAVDGTVERDGRTLVRLRATGVGDDADAERSVQFLQGTATDVDGTVLVARDGKIASMNLTVDRAANESLAVAFAVDDAPGPVPRPGWLADVPDVDVSVSERTDADRVRVLAVENAGSEPIPAGRTLSVSRTGLTFGNVTLPASVEPGERAYLYQVGPSTYDATVRVSVGTPPSLPANATDFGFGTSVLVTIRDGPITATVGLPENETVERVAWSTPGPRDRAGGHATVTLAGGGATVAPPTPLRAAGAMVGQRPNSRTVS